MVLISSDREASIFDLGYLQAKWCGAGEQAGGGFSFFGNRIVAMTRNRSVLVKASIIAAGRNTVAQRQQISLR